MSVSLEYLERCSAETGFQIPALEKVVRLGELATEIARHALLGEILLMKGGTALNLAFSRPTRLSVDLDYNYIGAEDRESMLAARPKVEKAVVDLARRARYAVQQSGDAFAGRKLHLRYRSVLGPEDRIEIDLNYLFRVPLVEMEVCELWQPGELDRPRVRVVGLEELVAGKFLALLDRSAARDAWDVANLSPEVAGTLGAGTFRARFITIAGILDHPLPRYGRARLESRITQRSVDEALVPMLAGGGGANAHDLVEGAWTRLEPLLSLTANEERYLTELHQGRLRPELLFPDDPAMVERLLRHPALAWKARNARDHHKKGNTDDVT